jgi:hypothetical protein
MNMRDLYLYRMAFIVFGAGLVLIGFIFLRRRDGSKSIAWWALGGFLCLNIGFVIYLWFNHIQFPLNLDLMEGTILQEFQRAASLQAVYPEPTPGYVPLAYNPLYYFLAVPFSWIFGVNLFTLRFAAILGMVGSGVILYLVVREKTNSIWWGFAAVGLFAGAYRVMDTYLDSAHSDSWLLFSALLGSYLIDRNKSRASSLIGVLVLVSAFWFKQHGALFAIGGLLYLTRRDGIKGSLVYWLTAIVTGPILYIFAGPTLFGPYFHYFTWEVPRRWSSFGLHTLRRYFGFIALSYPILALSGGLTVLWKLVKDTKKLSIWDVQFVFALLTGFMGSLDAGSSHNIYIPMGMWFILLGSIGLWEFSRKRETLKRLEVHVLALFVTFAFFIYNPSTVIVSPRAGASYAEFINVLKKLDGAVYAPSLGQLQKDYAFYPAVHWAALEDMIRKPGFDTRNHPNTRRLLDPVIHPKGPAYIFANYPLDEYSWIAFLGDYYVLEKDFQAQFKPLRVLPKRWDHGWPRYLYRYARSEAVPR